VDTNPHLNRIFK
jgi:hypothetical protein